MEELKQEIVEAFSDAIDFEYDTVDTSLFYSYLDEIFDNNEVKNNIQKLYKALEMAINKFNFDPNVHDSHDEEEIEYCKQILKEFKS